MPGTNNHFSRVKIEAGLKDLCSEVLVDVNAVGSEYVFPNKTKADDRCLEKAVP